MTCQQRSRYQFFCHLVLFCLVFCKSVSAQQHPPSSRERSLDRSLDRSRERSLDRSRERSPDRSARESFLNPQDLEKTLILGSFRTRPTERYLKRELATYGEVTKVYLPTKDGRQLGYAFVTFATTHEAESALESYKRHPFHHGFFIGKPTMAQLQENKLVDPTETKMSCSQHFQSSQEKMIKIGGRVNTADIYGEGRVFLPCYRHFVKFSGVVVMVIGVTAVTMVTRGLIS